jgi:type IV pilus assembly protein PilP
MNIITMKKAAIITALGTVFLTGCANGEYNDISQWMKEQEKTLKGKIDPLPPAKTFSPIAFSAQEDPFVKKPSLSINQIDNNKYAPDPDRRKEPLESYQLPTLKMIGTLYKDKKFYAIIKTTDNVVHYVTLGNYLGSSYGKIIKLNENQIVLDERIQESDEWKQKETTIYLDDGDKK